MAPRQLNHKTLQQKNCKSRAECKGSKIQLHCRNEYIKCPFCHKSYLTHPELLSHIISMHVQKQQNLFTCIMCSKPFNSDSNLKRHIRFHTGEKPHDCNICFVSFADFGALKRHKTTHLVEKRFKCEICRNSFTRADTLRNHMTSHTGEMGYQCKLCQRRFNTSNTLRLHEQTRHSGESINCWACGTSFKHVKYLKRHQSRVHGNRKLHRCDFCNGGTGFMSRYELFKHVRRHIHERPYSCHCGKEFTTTCELSLHNRRC